jgi:hypothetical protein
MVRFSDLVKDDQYQEPNMTLAEQGYEFIRYEGDGVIMVRDIETDNVERFFLHDDCASWHLVFEGHTYEFMHSVKQEPVK